MKKQEDRFATLKWAAIIILMIAPAIICLLFIRSYGVNVCWWDQWEFIPLFDKFFSGQLSFSDLFAQHNEHRIFFPRLVTLLLGILTHYNNVAEMYFSWFLLCLISGVLIKIHLKIAGSSQISFAKFIPVTWLIFSLRQWENLLWGFQIAWFMVVLFLLLSLYLLWTSEKIGWRFVFSIICGIVCSFSSGQGLLIWPIGLFQILWIWWSRGKGSKPLYLKMLSIWILAGILVYIAYSIGYIKPSHHPSLLYFMHSPVSAASYLLVCIGSPFSTEIYTAAATGIMILALYIYVAIYEIKYTIKNNSQAQLAMAIPFSLILFAVLTAATLVLTRSGFGVGQASSSRYTTVTIMGIVGLYLVILHLKTRRWNLKPFLFGFVLSLITLGTVVTYVYTTTSEGKSVKDYRNQLAYYLSTCEFQSDEKLALLYPDPQVVRERAEILNKYKLNVFSSPHSASANQLTLGDGSTLFYIDTINDHQPAQQGFHVIIDAQQEKDITISGWAVDQKAAQAASGVFINIDGQKDIPAIYGLDRSDVARYFNVSTYRFSGFSASFATSLLDKGQHALSVKIVTADKKGYYEPDQKIILEVR